MCNVSLEIGQKGKVEIERWSGCGTTVENGILERVDENSFIFTPENDPNGSIPLTDDYIEKYNVVEFIEYFNLDSAIKSFETEYQNVSQVATLFSNLVKTGEAWNKGAFYAGTATTMINAGILDRDGNINEEALEEATV